MIPDDPLLRQLRDFDRASRFYEHLADLVRGDEYQGVFPDLRDEGLA